MLEAEVKEVCSKCKRKETCTINIQELQDEINLAIKSLDGEEAYDSIEMQKYVVNCIKVFKEKVFIKEGSKEEEKCEGSFYIKRGPLIRFDQ